MSRLNIMAWKEGFVVFGVNGKVYWTYDAAQAACDAVPENESVYLSGWNLYRFRWLCFYIRSMKNDLHLLDPNGFVDNWY